MVELEIGKIVWHPRYGRCKIEAFLKDDKDFVYIIPVGDQGGVVVLISSDQLKDKE